MERKLSELDLETVILFQFLDTPGDEIAPGSNEVGKDFEDERFRHGFLLRNSNVKLQSTRNTGAILGLLAVGSQLGLYESFLKLTFDDRLG